MDRIIRIRRAVRAFFRCSLWLWLTAGIIPGARIVPGRADAVAHHQKGVEAQRDLQALCRLSVESFPRNTRIGRTVRVSLPCSAASSEGSQRLSRVSVNRKMTS